jgi:hypothetical protein
VMMMVVIMVMCGVYDGHGSGGSGDDGGGG